MSDGVIVAWWLPPVLAEQLAVEGYELADELHMTLAFLGKLDDLSADQRTQVMRVVADFAKRCSPLEGTIAGMGRFVGEPDDEGVRRDPVYLCPDVPGLNEFRADLVGDLAQAGFVVNAEHGFTPHITLAYVPAGQPAPCEMPAPEPIDIDRLTLKMGDARIDWVLAGTPVEKSADDVAQEAIAAHAQLLADEGLLTVAPVWERDGEAVMRVHTGEARTTFVRMAPGKGPDIMCVLGPTWAESALDLPTWVERTVQIGDAEEISQAIAKWLDEPQPQQPTYRIVRSAPQQRYTLGVAYTQNEVDGHGDYTTTDELEAAAWRFIQNANAGVMHRAGTDFAGEVVESYIYRGPHWEVGDQVIKAGDWLVGVVWDEPTWAKIESGEYTGYSIQGWGEATT